MIYIYFWDTGELEVQTTKDELNKFVKVQLQKRLYKQQEKEIFWYHNIKFKQLDPFMSFPGKGKNHWSYS